MASFNRVILMGNLTRDPEVRYIASGTAVTDLGLAVNRSWTDKQTGQRREEVTFVDVTLWGRQAEIAGEYLSKGRAVLIEGRLQLDTWQDKESGQNRSKLRVVCENMTMVGGRGDAPGGGGGGNYGGGSSQQDESFGDESYGGRQGGGPQAGGRSSGGRQPSPPPPARDPADAFYDNPGGDVPEDEVPF